MCDSHRAILAEGGQQSDAERFEIEDVLLEELESWFQYLPTWHRRPIAEHKVYSFRDDASFGACHIRDRKRFGLGRAAAVPACSDNGGGWLDSRRPAFVFH